MKMPSRLETRFFAPCGVNCAVCSAHLRAKKPCPGCLFEDAGKPKHCLNCSRKLCAEERGITHCFTCDKFSCRRIKSLDKNYITRYEVSPVENGHFVKQNGLDAFMQNEAEKWRCQSCGGMLCQHSGLCSACGE